VDAIIRATNTPIGGDTFAPISRLLGEVVATRLAQVGVATCYALMSMTWKKILPARYVFFVSNVYVCVAVASFHLLRRARGCDAPADISRPSPRPGIACLLAIANVCVKSLHVS
jgi:hypothetical protein